MAARDIAHNALKPRNESALAVAKMDNIAREYILAKSVNERLEQFERENKFIATIHTPICNTYQVSNTSYLRVGTKVHALKNVLTGTITELAPDPNQLEA